MRYRIKMIDNQGRIVASTIKEVPNVGIEGLKLVEKAQNDVLRSMGFQGHCELEAEEKPE